MKRKETTLTERAMKELETTFTLDFRHYPTKEQYAALRDICQTVEDMANDIAKPCIHLSDVAAGVGKSQSLIHSYAEIMLDPSKSGVGMMICVSRIEQIEKLFRGFIEHFKRLQHRKRITPEQRTALEGRIGFYTRRYPEDHPNNLESTLGRSMEGHDLCQVLLTTQQMVMTRLERVGGDFSKCDEFIYLVNDPELGEGLPQIRRVKAWDEYFQIGRPLNIPIHTIEDMMSAFDPKSTVRQQLRKAAKEIRAIEDGETWTAGFLFGDLTLIEIHVRISLGFPPKKAAQLQNYATALYMMENTTAKVRRAGYKICLLNAADLALRNFYGLIVCDASATVREAYNEAEAHRPGLIRRLKTCSKDHSRVTIHRASTGAGKVNWHIYKGHFVKAIGDVIRSMPGGTLIVHYKDSAPYVTGIEEAIRENLEEGPKGFTEPDFLTWGRHDATNEFKDNKNVIAPGVLNFHAWDYLAGLMAARNLQGDKADLDEKAIDNYATGERKHLLLQAVNRASMRKIMPDGKAAECDVFLATPDNSGLTDEVLLKMFPGAKVVPWNGFEPPRKLKRRVKANARKQELTKVAEFISEQCDEQDAGEPLKILVTVDEALKLITHDSRQQGLDALRKSKTLKGCLRNQGIRYIGRRGRGAVSGWGFDPKLQAAITHGF